MAQLHKQMERDWLHADCPSDSGDGYYISRKSEILFENTFNPLQTFFDTHLYTGLLAYSDNIPWTFEETLWDAYCAFLDGIHGLIADYNGIYTTHTDLIRKVERVRDRSLKVSD